jgi:hypothetical protein
MTSLFRLGQLLRGNVGTYTIQKQLHESIWLAMYVGKTIILFMDLQTDIYFTGATVNKVLSSKAFDTSVSKTSVQFSNAFKSGLPRSALSLMRYETRLILQHSY